MRAAERVALQQRLGVGVELGDLVLADERVAADEVGRRDRAAPAGARPRSPGRTRAGCRRRRPRRRGGTRPRSGSGSAAAAGAAGRCRSARAGCATPSSVIPPVVIGPVRVPPDGSGAVPGCRWTGRRRTTRSAPVVEAWVEEHVPQSWRDGRDAGGRAAIRAVRSRADYEAWYPTFADSGLAVATWPVAYGGLDLAPAQARVVEARARAVQPRAAEPARPEQRRARAVRVRHRGAAAAVPAAARAQRGEVVPAVQRAGRGLGPRVARDPGRARRRRVGASPARRCGPRGRTSPTSRSASRAPTRPSPKRSGLTYFLVDLHQPGVEVRPLRHIGGEVDFNEVFLDDVRVPDAQRVGAVGDGWRVAGATLVGRAADGVGRRARAASTASAGAGVDARAAAGRELGRTRRPGRPPGADAALQRGAHPRLDPKAI